jgi:poly(hydroxyalkanoate) granule-associated protein
MARTTTKRTTRAARKPRASIDRLKSVALAQAKVLAKSGAALQNEGRTLAVAKARQARNAIVSGAEQARARATEAVTRFERIFEDRVGRVISKMGVPTTRDVRALSRQVAHLQQSVDQLRRSRARA